MGLWNQHRSSEKGFCELVDLEEGPCWHRPPQTPGLPCCGYRPDLGTQGLYLYSYERKIFWLKHFKRLSQMKSFSLFLDKRMSVQHAQEPKYHTRVSHAAFSQRCGIVGVRGEGAAHTDWIRSPWGLHLICPAIPVALWAQDPPGVLMATSIIDWCKKYFIVLIYVFWKKSEFLAF